MIKRYFQVNQIVSKYSLFLFGPRGVGKSSLVENYLSQIPHKLVFDFLHLQTLSRYKQDPVLFQSEVKQALGGLERLVVFIDEIQLFPEILNEVHSLMEKHGDRLRFILTGSSARKLKRADANLLGGRAAELKLHPLSALELELNLYTALRFGTLPKMYLLEDPTELLKAYVNTYLREEIVQEALVRKTESFVRFLELAAQYNGKLINFTSLAKSIKIAVTTVQEYFSILIDTLIATRLDPWSYSVKKQLSSAPKFYFFDCGILNSINRTLSVPVNSGTFHFGMLFETFVINELSHQCHYLGKDVALNHYRTTAGEEIDVILNRGPFRPPFAVEIKSESAPQDLKTLAAFGADYPDAKLFCICTTPKSYRLGKILVLPWETGINEIVAQA